MIYWYARVSTKGQEKKGNSLENQVAELKAAGAEKIYTEAFTGAKCSRPEFDKLINELKPKDTLVACKILLDNMKDLRYNINIVRDLAEKVAKKCLLVQGIIRLKIIVIQICFKG